MESSTNSPMGSYHWFHSLISFILHTGEYLEVNGKCPSEELTKIWGKSIKDRSLELIEGFNHIESPEVLSRHQLVNQCETGPELEKAILSLADANGAIQGRKKIFRAVRMAMFVPGVIAGSLPPECLTREFGIRQQALYIKYYEDAQRQAISPSDD